MTKDFSTNLNDTLLNTVNQSIDAGFNINHQFVSYVIEQLNQADLGITTEQAQHLVNILEYVSKQAAKSGAVSAINALLEAGLLKQPN